jgi:hypothetical protein
LTQTQAIVRELAQYLCHFLAGTNMGSTFSTASLHRPLCLLIQYSGVVEQYRKISAEISKLENQINEIIYELYGLDADEISMIEHIFDQGSVILSLFQKPKELV